MVRQNCCRVWPSIVAVLLTSFIAGSASAQPIEVGQVRDLPKKGGGLDEFKKKLAEQPIPPVNELWNEIKRLEWQRQRLAELRDEPAVIDTIITKSTSILNDSKQSANDPQFCAKNPSAVDVKRWWDDYYFNQLKGISQDAARYVGEGAKMLSNPAQVPDPNESCDVYRKKIVKATSELENTITASLKGYQDIEQEKRATIPVVSDAYGTRIERLKKALDDAQQKEAEKSSTSLYKELWLIVLILGGVSITILILVRFFSAKAQLELIQSGQVIQFITVLLLLTVILAFGLTGNLKENTIGTLIGGLAGYVLSQGVGRAAQHAGRNAYGHEPDGRAHIVQPATPQGLAISPDPRPAGISISDQNAVANSAVTAGAAAVDAALRTAAR